MAVRRLAPRVRRTPMLLEQISEGFVGKFLHGRHAVERELVEGVPGLGIEFYASAHRAFGSRTCSHQLAFFARFLAGPASAACTLLLPSQA